MTYDAGGTPMKAIVWTKYGSPDGLQLREVAKPAPRDNEVLIKVNAATASTPDSELRRLKLPLLYAIPLRLYIGFIKPTRITILGTEFAGEIEATGKDVTLYKTGDEIFGYTGLAMGTYAEYMCLAEKPSAMAGVFAKKRPALQREYSLEGVFRSLRRTQRRSMVRGDGDCRGSAEPDRAFRHQH